MTVVGNNRGAVDPDIAAAVGKLLAEAGGPLRTAPGGTQVTVVLKDVEDGSEVEVSAPSGLADLSNSHVAELICETASEVTILETGGSV